MAKVNKTKVTNLKRKKVFVRDNFTCHYCGKKADQVIERRCKTGMLMTLYEFGNWKPFEIEHKKPRKDGGTNDLRNLLTSCAGCNNKKKGKTYKHFIYEMVSTSI